MASSSSCLHGPHSQQQAAGANLSSDRLPVGIWQAMFRPQQQLPHLQNLRTDSWTTSNNHGGVQDVPATAFSATDVSRLVGSCPGLQDLSLELQPDVQLAALAQLTDLTTLRIYMATASSVKSLSGLSGLRGLDVNACPACSPAALLPLTALRQLTRLDVMPVEGMGGAHAAWVNLSSQVSVWLQAISDCHALLACLHAC